MNRFIWLGLAAFFSLSVLTATTEARGFGGGFGRGGGGFGGARFGGGGGWGGGGERFGGGGFGGERFGGGDSFGGYRSSSYGGFHSSNFGAYGEGSRSFGAGSGAYGGRYAGGSYDKSWTGSRGGSVNVDGRGGVVEGPRGNIAAGGNRSVSVTGPDGRSYSGDSRAGVVAGQEGFAAGRSREGTATGLDGRSVSDGSRAGVVDGERGFVAGGSRYGAATGPRGTVADGSRWGAASTHFATDHGLGRYSTFGAAGVGVGHATAYWSHSTVVARAGYVRTGFGYWGCFRPGWWGGYPLAWGASALWVAGTAWATPAWPVVGAYIAMPEAPIYYDYGSTVVYQGGNVYVNGADVATADQYTQQAQAIATQGADAKPPAEAMWQALGVYALVQGDEKTSNTVFQLAVDAKGVLRGNYYDGLQNTTTPISGSVDKKSQRAAWIIGTNKGTVFETGIYNLTKDETPVLVHFGKDRTQQWLLVRMQEPKDGKEATPPK